MTGPRLGLIALGLLVALAGVSRAGAVTRGEVIQSIAVFQKDPASKEGFAAASKVMAFAGQSRAIHVALSKAVVPWLKGNDVTDADTRHILLTAYVAGNVQAQLKSGHPQDNVYAGWQQVLATYSVLLSINSAAKIAEVDELKKKDSDGTLQAYAAEVQSK